MRGNLRLLERITAAGGVEAFRSVLARTDPSIVVLSVPFLGPFVAAARARGIRVIADADESLVRANRSILRSGAPSRARLRALLDLQEARRFEPREYRRVDQVWVASKVELRYFASVLPDSDIRVVPNLAPGAGPAEDLPGPIRKVAFVGSYGYGPNEEAALSMIRTIMPAIRRLTGPIELVLIGRDPTPAMRELAARSESVRITGTVADPVTELRDAGVLVVPLRAGAGSRIKILEAMLAGVPVVTTAAGLEGLDAAPGRDVLVAESAEAFAEAVARLRADDVARGELTRSATVFVREHHSQTAISAAVTRALGSSDGPTAS
jgi:glycosyltransferase involved in cell wall biosynthesis